MAAPVIIEISAMVAAMAQGDLRARSSRDCERRFAGTMQTHFSSYAYLFLFSIGYRLDANEVSRSVFEIS